MSDLAEEILYLIGKRGKIETREVQDRFNLSRETATSVVDFLVEFGFAELDQSKRYIRLSEPCKKFFEETIDQDRDQDSRERLTLTVAYL